MISNPAVVKKGGGQVYTITDNTPNGARAPSSAEAGQRVTYDCTEATGGTNTIEDSNGKRIPYGLSYNVPSVATRAPSLGSGYFIMPSSNITIS